MDGGSGSLFGWRLDLRGRTLRREGAEVRLTALEASLLARLAERHPDAVSREELLGAVWGFRPGLKTRAVDHTVNRLRRKLEEVAETPRIGKAQGLGYRLEAPGIAEPLFGREETLREARAVLRRGGVVVLAGPPGSGRSRLLRALAAEVAPGTFVEDDAASPVHAPALVTSVRPTGSAGERLVRVGPLDLGSGVALLAEVAERPRDAGWEELVAALDGSPVALSAVAPLLRDVPAGELVARARARLLDLVGGEAGAFAASVARGFEALAPAARDAIALLARLPAGGTTPTVERVAGSAAADALPSLVAFGWLRLSQEPGERARHELPRTIGAWAGTCVPERSAARDARIAWATEVAATDGDPDAPWDSARLRRLRTEAVNLEAAARDADDATAARLLGALPFETGPARTARGAELGRLTEALADTEAGLAGWTAFRWAVLLTAEGRPDEAEAAARRALALAGADRHLEGRALAQLALLEGQRGRTDRAREGFEAAVRRLEGGSPPASLGMQLANLAVLDQMEGRFDAAEVGLRRAAALLARAAPAPRARVHHNLGTMLLATGRAEGSEEHLVRAAALFGEAGDPAGSASTLAARAHAALDLGRHDDAVALAERAVDEHARTGQRRSEAAARVVLGCVRFDLGDLEGADAQHRQALVLARPDRTEVGAVVRGGAAVRPSPPVGADGSMGAAKAARVSAGARARGPGRRAIGCGWTPRSTVPAPVVAGSSKRSHHRLRRDDVLRLRPLLDPEGAHDASRTEEWRGCDAGAKVGPPPCHVRTGRPLDLPDQDAVAIE